MSNTIDILDSLGEPRITDIPFIILSTRYCLLCLQYGGIYEPTLKMMCIEIYIK